MLRQLHPQDLPNLLIIESKGQIMPWSEEVFERCLQAGSSGWVIEVENNVVGFIITLFQMEEAHILNFCVHPDFQHQGYGKQLLMQMLDDIKQKSAKWVYLEVRRSNLHAITLYEKIGFKKIGERKDYYRALTDSEDALVFAMTFNSK